MPLTLFISSVSIGCTNLTRISLGTWIDNIDPGAQLQGTSMQRLSQRNPMARTI